MSSQIKHSPGNPGRFIYDRIKSGDLPKAKVIHGRARWLYRDHCEFKNKLLSRANG
ncbi:excisionase [Escherichia coli]